MGNPTTTYEHPTLGPANEMGDKTMRKLKQMTINVATQGVVPGNARSRPTEAGANKRGRKVRRQTMQLRLS